MNKNISYLSKPKTVRQKWATFSLSQWVVETHIRHSALPSTVRKLTCNYESSFSQPTRRFQFIWGTTIFSHTIQTSQSPKDFFHNDFFSLHSSVVYCLFLALRSEKYHYVSSTDQLT